MKREAEQTTQPVQPVPALEELYRAPEPGAERGTLIGLDRNERLSPLPAEFIARIRSAIDSDLLSRYPIQTDLLNALAVHAGLPTEHLLLTVGSDAAVKAIYQTYIRPGDRVLMLHPSYAMYSVYAQMFLAKMVPVGFNEGMVLDTDRLFAGIRQSVRLVMIANPNQPTGTLIDESMLRELITTAKRLGTLVTIDEAYHPFSRFTVLPWVKEHDNLVVLRTFSKAAGLAGARIGFAASHPATIGNLFKVRSVCDVSSLSILCATEILRNPSIIDDYVAEVEAGRSLLALRVAEFGLVPLPSRTNFMIIRVGQRCSPHLLIERLREQGYLVRGPFSDPLLADCIRVTLGPPSLMTRFADALGVVLSRLGGGDGC